MDDDATPPVSVGATDRVADAVSIASDFGAAWIVVAVLQVVLGRSSIAEATRRLASAGVASLVLTRVLKHHFGVPREPVANDGTFARTPTSTSFPSGHTLAAFTSAIVVPTSSRGRALGVAFASLVAWARVRVGHHRPEDVLAGAAVGAAAGALLLATFTALDGD
jgi:membrane-associated phospholipid phosphatase